MRTKELCFVVAFQTTTQAILCEQMAKKNNVSGRLIPIPTQITAGCGLAWKMKESEKQTMIDLLQKQNLRYDKCYTLTI